MLKFVNAAVLALAVILVPTLASAHVVVSPGNVKPGEFTTFTVSVINEKEMNVTGIKLDLPKDMKFVTPTVKPGWTIESAKSGTGEAVVVSSITWSGGTIGAGLRDDFSFSAQAPAKPTDLNWNALQTYEDGTVASWNQDPKAEGSADDNLGPYSTTKVLEEKAAVASTTKETSSDNTLPLVLSLLALSLSVASLLFRKKTN